MSDILKCPFCGGILEQSSIYKLNSYACTDLTCKGYFMTATKDMWQALIDTKKKLDIRKKQVEIANKAFDFINTEWDNVDCSRKELGACAFNAKEDIAGWESDIETAEQKDVK